MKYQSRPVLVRFGRRCDLHTCCTHASELGPTVYPPPNGTVSFFLFVFKVVWVTGADHGLGEQLAINLAVNGARVSLLVTV